MQNFTVKVEPIKNYDGTGYSFRAYVYPENSTTYTVRDYGYSVEGATLNVLYAFASYCIKNGLTADCIEAEQRDRLQVYIEQINRTGEFSQ